MTWAEESAIVSIYAATVNDFESFRIALDNRLRSLEGTAMEGHLDLMMLASKAKELEGATVKGLEKAMKKHPLGTWVAAQTGIGLKTAGRLLGVIGDPYIRPPRYEDGKMVEPARPRFVSELWSYCGYGDAEQQVRRRGEQGNWNPEAKKRLFVIAERCMVAGKGKPGAKYRTVYDRARVKYQDAVHQKPCVRCGPSGHPAPIGSPLNDGHKHARALRKVAKEILRDLWIEAQRLHQDQSNTENHARTVLVKS